MKFKIPKPLLYFALGLNLSLLMLGIALSSFELSLLAIISGMLCATPIIFEKEEE